MRVEREFRSEPEALAFVAGVEYVGDPAVRLAEVVPPADAGGAWRVALDDDSVLPDAGDPADADEYSDDAPPED
jgi:hypothetical protein